MMMLRRRYDGVVMYEYIELERGREGGIES